MKALIISGFDWKKIKIQPYVECKKNFFSISGKIFYRFLRQELELPVEDISLYGVKKRDFSADDLLKFIEEVDQKSKSEPLLIYYTGHGDCNTKRTYPGWLFSDKIVFPYEALVEALGKRTAPLIVVNDCCFSMWLATYMEKLKCENLLIATAPKNRIGYESVKVINEILRFWEAGKPANPRYFNNKKFLRNIRTKSGRIIKVILRSGDALDHHCYSKK